MAIIKQGGVLTQISDEELQKQSTAAATPLSPSAAKAQGATPDQAKMAGTPAAKQPIYKASVETPTLQQAQRQAVTTAPDPAASQQAKDKMDRMKSLGTLNVQIENLIQSKITQATTQVPTQATLSQEALTTIPEEKRAQASTLLSAYATLTDPAAKQSKLVEISNLLGRAPTAQELAGYFQQAPAVLEAAIKGATPTAVYVADLGLPNSQQVADDLGIPIADLNKMTVEQLQQAVSDTEAREYNRVQDIQAQLVSATGARREQLLRELSGEAQVGTTGIEAQFDALQQQIDEAKTITIGGQDLSLESILSDDSLSKLITDATTDEAKLKILAQTEPALAKWITDNKASLESLAAGMREEARTFGAIQDEASKAASDLTAGAFEALFGKRPEYMTQAELDTLKATIQGNAVYKTMQADPAFKTIIETDPKIAVSLKGKTEQEIKTLLDQYNTIRNDPALAIALGITDSNKFSTTKLDIQTTKDTLDKFSDTKEKMDVAGWLKDGTITSAQATLLAENLDQFDEIAAEINYKKEFEKASSRGFDSLVEFVFGGKAKDVTANINKQIAELSKIAPFDPEAAKRLAQLQDIAGQDGIFDKNDMTSLQANLKSGGLDNIVAGGDSTVTKKDKWNTLSKTPYVSSPEVQEVQRVLADNTITLDEILSMGPAGLERFSNNPYIKSTFPQAASVFKQAQAINDINVDSITNAYINGQLGQGVPVSKQEDFVIDLVSRNALTSDQLEALRKGGVIPFSVKNAGMNQEVTNIAGMDLSNIDALSLEQVNTALDNLNRALAANLIPKANINNVKNKLVNLQKISDAGAEKAKAEKYARDREIVRSGPIRIK